MSEQLHGSTEHGARRAVVRGAALFTPLFVVGVVVTFLSILSVINAGPVLTVIEALVTLLFAYQSIQSLRDLRSPLKRTEGRIGRRWSKLDFFITKSYYIAVAGTIFRIPLADWYHLAENDQVVVTHYPHTGAVASVEFVQSGQGRR